MKFAEILSDVEVAGVLGDPNAEVTDIFYDSRAVRPGGLFVAYKGSRSDGHVFIGEAVENGAVALIVESGGSVPTGVTAAVVSNGRRAMALAAVRLWGFPSASLTTVGVTGTDGKTSTAWLIRHILTSAVLETALFSTVGVFLGAEERSSKLTTAEAPDLQRDLRRAVVGGAQAAVIECSSHGLVLERITGTEFDAAVFTNLSHDHLDLHGDVESYFAVKRRLFEMLKPGGTAVVNMDDEYGRRMVDDFTGGCLTYGGSTGADFVFSITGRRENGLPFELEGPGGCQNVVLPFCGAYNAYNATAAVAASYALGVPWEDAAGYLSGAPQVPGRLETIKTGGLTVIIDYAHTPGAMTAVLEEIRTAYPDKYTVIVFGCPGDRDREKRPAMGGLSARYGDYVIVTNDDPYYENPARIADEVVAGISGEAEYTVELNRAAAVRKGLNEARKHEPAVVAILGKGHEEVQKVAGEEIPYNDRETVLKLLNVGRK